MPRYDYECTSCGAIHEDIFFLMQEDHRPCPECGSTKMVQDISLKQISAVTEDNFTPYFSVRRDEWVSTRADERADHKKWEAKGYSVGPRRSDDGPQSKADKKLVEEVARYGPVAQETHRMRGQAEAKEKKRKEIDKVSVSVSTPRP